jgi:hypothetical protein|tara:strand:- start:1629 stop:2240 length:612 start_codon:yes stop_codon:yes gene_type:complete
MAKCPPGVICFENFTFLYIIISILLLVYLMYMRQSSVKIELTDLQKDSHSKNNFGYFPKPNFSFTNMFHDVLMNPYTPPLKNDDTIPLRDIRGQPGIPINISTQSVDTNYRQVGILKRLNGQESILPLMGRPLFVNRDKWQYYTMTDSNNSIKLPVTFKQKSCTSEYGCDQISNGDTVYVDGINAPFSVTVYDNDTIRYIPYI